MHQFHIVNESTEDTLESTNSLQDAIRVAREAAKQAQVGDPVSILERGGMAVRQFVLMADGTIAEQTMPCPVKLPASEAERNGAEQVAALDPARK